MADMGNPVADAAALQHSSTLAPDALATQQFSTPAPEGGRGRGVLILLRKERGYIFSFLLTVIVVIVGLVVLYVIYRYRSSSTDPAKAPAPAPAPAPTPTPALSKPKMIGCYGDSGDRTMTWLPFTNAPYMTLEECQREAAIGGYKYFALQHGQSNGKAACFASNDLTASQRLGPSVGCTARRHTCFHKALGREMPHPI